MPPERCVSSRAEPSRWSSSTTGTSQRDDRAMGRAPSRRWWPGSPQTRRTRGRCSPVLVRLFAGGDLAMIEDKSRAGRPTRRSSTRPQPGLLRNFYRLFLGARPALPHSQPSRAPRSVRACRRTGLRPARRSARSKARPQFLELGIHPGRVRRGRCRGWWVRTRGRPAVQWSQRRRVSSRGASGS